MNNQIQGDYNMDDYILNIRFHIHAIESRAKRLTLEQAGEYYRRLDYWGDKLTDAMGWPKETGKSR